MSETAELVAAEAELSRLRQSDGMETSPEGREAMRFRIADARNEMTAANREWLLKLLSDLDTLLAQRAVAVEALEPFAEVAEHDIGEDEHDADRFRPMSQHNHAPLLTVGDFRRARAARASIKGDTDGN